MGRIHRHYCPRCVTVSNDGSVIEFCEPCAIEAISIDRMLGKIYSLNPQLSKIEPAEFIRRMWEKVCNAESTKGFRPVQRT